MAAQQQSLTNAMLGDLVCCTRRLDGTVDDFCRPINAPAFPPKAEGSVPNASLQRVRSYHSQIAQTQSHDIRLMKAESFQPLPPVSSTPGCAKVVMQYFGCCWGGVAILFAYVVCSNTRVWLLESRLGTVGFILLAVVLVLACMCNILSALDVERLPAARAAFRLFRYWERDRGRALHLPDKFRGVFWFSDQAGPHLLVCLESMDVSLQRQTSTLWAPSRYTFSYCDTGSGWLLYLLTRLFGVHAFSFKWDHQWERATIRIWPLGFLPPMLCDPFIGMTVSQLDPEGESWALDVFMPSWNPRPSPWASCTLVKVIDMDGFELPGFNAMMRTIIEGHIIKESTVKSKEQIVPTY